MTKRERVRMHLVQALTRAENDDVRSHLESALEAFDQLPLTPLAQCPLCEAVGLPERLREHDCTAVEDYEDCQ